MSSPPRSSSVSIRWMSWHESPLTSRTSAARSPRGIVRVPAQELARERVPTGGGLAGPDGAEHRHAGRESALGDHQPFAGRALDGSDRVMDLPDDDRRAGRRRRKWPRGKAGPEPETYAHPGEPDPRRADEKLAREEHGHAGRDVVPGRRRPCTRSACDTRTSTATGSPSGNTPWPRPGARGADAADDEKARRSASRIGPLGVVDRPACARAGEPSCKDT